MTKLHQLKLEVTREAAKRDLLVSVVDQMITVVDKNGDKFIDSLNDSKSGWLKLGAALGISKEAESANPPQSVKAETDNLIIYTDGGSRGNPGPSASGYVIMDSDGEILEEGGEYLGITTNNQAEYQAVKLALERAEKFKPESITFKIDSLLVVNQMNGKYKVKNRDLWPIHEAIKQLRDKFKQVEFSHVRREYNKLADAKVNEVLDSRAQ